MQERVTPSGDDFAEIVVQHQPNFMSVGIGLEPRSEVPSQHFVDAIYGDVPGQTKIGQIFRVENDYLRHLDFASSDQEVEFDNALGRAILDAIIGSAAVDGMWTWLDRSGVNRLIRLLRKARDSSFGRDE